MVHMLTLHQDVYVMAIWLHVATDYVGVFFLNSPMVTVFFEPTNLNQKYANFEFRTLCPSPQGDSAVLPTALSLL